MVAMAPRPRRVLSLLVDNYDSYTFNIFQMLAEVNGVAPIVVKNDDFGGDWGRAWAFFLQEAQRIEAKYNGTSSAVEGSLQLAYNVVISPGPGHPAVPGDFGMCADMIRNADVPLLGVCLGHQGLAQVYGGSVVNAPEVMHGRTSRVVLKEAVQLSPSLFAHIPSGFEVVRYHSLTVHPDTLPKQLNVTARTEDGVIMALQHCEKLQYGVQFHPEAVCSTFGYQIFQNFRDATLGVCPSKCLLEHGDRWQPSLLGGIDSSGDNSAPALTSSAHYKVLIDRVAAGIASLDFAQYVFEELFGSAPRSFWLDSSNFTDGEDAAIDDPAGVEGRQRSRFSFMGDNSGPLSHCFEYSVLHKLLRVHHADGSIDTIEKANAMDHLRTQLRGFQSHETELVGGGDEQIPFSFRGGYVGYLGYEMLENGLEDPDDASAEILRAHLCGKLSKGEYVPDLSLLFADRVLVFDHKEGCIHSLSVTLAEENALTDSRAWHRATAQRLLHLASTMSSRTKSAPTPTQTDRVVFHPSRSRPQYIEDISTVQRQIHDGETYEVCLTNQLRSQVSIRDPLSFYGVLRQRNPAPYAAFYMSNPAKHFTHGSMEPSTGSPPSGESIMESTYAVCCSSPERFLRVEPDGWMESKPIKGTRRRGHTLEEDREIINELAHCEKDRAENMMIADLVRNDFGRVAQIGTVHVPKLMKVESYATVHQLVTTVRAKRSSQADIVDVIKATFPGGSMTGAPKKRTMQLIRTLEMHPRGVYSGALGFLSLDGSCDLNIIIRTALITKQSVSLGSGGAIVALSDCEDEYDEMLLKTKALVQAIGAFVTGRQDGSGAVVEPTTL